MNLTALCCDWCDTPKEFGADGSAMLCPHCDRPCDQTSHCPKCVRGHERIKELDRRPRPA